MVKKKLDSTVENHVLGCRNSTSCKKKLYFLCRFTGKKLHAEAFSLCSQQFKNNVALDEIVVANALRACSGTKVSVQYVQQIHAKCVHSGFIASPLVCNPIIDFYLKNEFVDCAFKFSTTCLQGTAVLGLP